LWPTFINARLATNVTVLIWVNDALVIIGLHVFRGTDLPIAAGATELRAWPLMCSVRAHAQSKMVHDYTFKVKWPVKVTCWHGEVTILALVFGTHPEVWARTTRLSCFCFCFHSTTCQIRQFGYLSSSHNNELHMAEVMVGGKEEVRL